MAFLWVNLMETRYYFYYDGNDINGIAERKNNIAFFL